MRSKDWTRQSIRVRHKKSRYPNIFDCIILGAGPAGMTATIYGARRKMSILLICGPKVGGQMKWSSDIENYPGVKKITGPALTDRFFDHVQKISEDPKHFDVWVRTKESARKIGKKKNIFEIHTDQKNVFRSKTILLTMGKIPRTLGIPGEEIAMKGNGLSFCATCDAPLYKDCKMAILGGGNSAMDVALQLEKYTDDITIFTDLDDLMGENVLMEKIKKSKFISVKYSIAVKEILLDKKKHVRGIRYTENGGKIQEFSCTGIFEEIGNIPATSFLEDFVKRNTHGEILTDARCRTNIPGVFAAGDATTELHKQIIVAAGQGAIAALEAHEYILNSQD
ncbi:FAD-dependent oxidoreductase [Candidatus Peregrinibacteria bacterium]|nr:FAD-dependent oxidoreductase [Candidatus Peregrinibacteria bacterium]